VDTSHAAFASFSAPVLPNVGSVAPDPLVLDVYSAEVGTFELGVGVDDNMDTCVHCLTLWTDGDVRIFVATEGTLTFDADSLQMEGYPQGTLRNVTLREATGYFNRLGPFYEKGHSTIVPGGTCFKISEADVLVNVAQPLPAPPGWACARNHYGDGTCDCGCGALDMDCAGTNVSYCQYCNCGNNDCSLVNATDNAVCDSVVYPPCTTITGLFDVIEDTSYLPAFLNINATTFENLGGGLLDVVGLDIYSSEVGTFALGTGLDGNVDTCERCVYLYEDTGNGKFYFATGGTLTFDPDSLQMEGYPKGTLRNVILREAIMDAAFHSTIVPAGSCIAIANADALVNATPPPPTPPEWVCAAAWYSDGTCDCGCGALDPTCTSSNADACDYCFCDGDNGSCTGSSVSPTQNYSCE
jgi:hypothetical protein